MERESMEFDVVIVGGLLGVCCGSVGGLSAVTGGGGGGLLASYYKLSY